MPYYCCVPGCDSTHPKKGGFKFFRFPLKKSICDVWLEKIGRPDLKKYEAEVLYIKYKICGKHFTDYHRCPGNRRLRVNSYPTLFLPDKPQCSSNNDKNTSQDTAFSGLLNDHDYFPTSKSEFEGKSKFSPPDEASVTTGAKDQNSEDNINKTEKENLSDITCINKETVPLNKIMSPEEDISITKEILSNGMNDLSINSLPDNNVSGTELLERSNDKQLEPKTFVFRKTKNLGLIIKSALKQCNFPSGTRLIRSVDFIEKGKAMYRIELPTDSNMKAKFKQNKLIKISPSKKKKKAPPSNDGKVSDEVTNKEKNDINSTTSWQSQQEILPGSVENESDASRISFERNFQNNGFKMNDEEMRFTRDLCFSLKKLAREPQAILESLKYKIPPGANWKSIDIWNDIIKTAMRKLEIRQKKRYEENKKRLKINKEKLRIKLKKEIMDKIKEENHIIDEQTSNKYMEKLFSATKINANPSKLLFLQNKFCPKKTGGRRYTVKDKIFSLSVYESIGKSHYNKIKKSIPLPCRKSLFSFLNKVPFSPGLNRQVFENLKKSIDKLSSEDKYCSLVFDEVALAEDAKNETNGQNGNFIKIRPQGDHIIILMLRGILRNWKQPIGFVVNDGDITSCNLAELIKDAIKLIVEFGLKPLATIFNTKNTFIEAVNYLKMETETYCITNDMENKYFGFLVGDVEVVPILSPIQLFKETRDTLLLYDIEYTHKGENKIASWEHVLQLFSCDQGDEESKICPRLSDKQVLTKKINSTKMESCSQVFSQRVSSVMRKLAILSANGIETRATETADFLLIMDQLLDSINGFTSKPPCGKPLKCGISPKSSHIAFWNETVEIMTSLKFIDHDDLNYIPLTVGDNWIATLLGYVYIIDKLFKDGVKLVSMKNCSNEPLDQFVESIRSGEGTKQKNPTYYFFLISYRTFVLSNNALGNCFLQDNSEEELPLDINREFVYDEGTILEEDNIDQTVNCFPKKDNNQEV